MQRNSNRPRRIGEVLKRELALVIPKEIDHPWAKQVTLTAVDVSPDLRSAKLFFTCLSDKEDTKEIGRILNQASGFLRHCLNDRVELRGVPKLRFIYDESIERGRRISALIDQVLTDATGSDTH